ncbi:MAG: 2-phospho-L-lactate guanylyltransferase [Rhodospirillales bacterium]|jgi:2-phospho-L-lactate/phosphoenolpyruvate guanylyltransferase|nr:2-phospho-L-lactate guanylyltransferase [Rhodospirillales bacterium]MBT4039346.1 2-phospho-L-lactate guanylyltransferase [Rhodospirillales bacterium]MBT4626252.1 2-phospho-L-lactate guanylyltransferase [Rhodospirillales bacterium]MBT5353079.1 2-phospho-L-lactate guanylyltransferase [Rhodospirillales bacterium]MBT5520766.1 2-phospho-L-lactate guanylyltransferase [Rhodospirillales bacterium]
MNQNEPLFGIWAVVPVKRFDLAKQRLSPVLNTRERQQLSYAMLGDVLDALSKASNIAGTLVVTCERDAMELAKTFDAEVLSETTSCGLCEAVATAGRYLDARGCAGMISIPGDVPLVCAEEIDRIIFNHGAAPAVTVIPAWDGGGTNALLCTPADVITPQFGENSFSAHKSAAIHMGLAPTVVPSLGLALDLDTPDDLPAFMEWNSDTRTARYLANIGVLERFDEYAHMSELRSG